MNARNFNRIHVVLIGLVIAGAIGLLFLLLPSAAPPSPKPVASPRPNEAKATLTVSPGLAQQGGPVSFQARGFRPGEAVILGVAEGATASGGTPTPTKTAGRSGVTLAQGRANAEGTLSVGPTNLPDDLYSGSHPLEAVGQASGRRATATLDVHAKAPWINLSTNGIKPHQTFGMIAGGFQPGESIRVSLEPAPHGPNGESQDPSKLSKPTTLTTLRTDRVGNSTWSQTPFPLLRPGAYTLVARGASSGKKLTENVVVEAFTPVVQLSPWAGPPGTRVELNVRGFAPGETVQVFLGQASTATLTTTADRYGNFWGAGPIQVPYDAATGSLPVRLVGVASGATLTMPFNVLAAKPWLDLSVWSGPPGAPVSFSGGGWAADERVSVHLGSASGPTVAEAQADDGGWLQAGGAAGVPGDARDAVTFVAVGKQSRATASASFKVVNPFDSLPQNLPPPNVAPPPNLSPQNPPS